MKKLYMQPLLILIWVTLFVNTTQAQNNVKSPAKRFLYHAHGISLQKFENLNARIARYPQYAEAKNSTGTLHLGLFTERNKLITSFSVNAGNSLSGDRKKKSSATRFLGLSADLGYNIINNKRLSIYPFAGLGYETYTLKYNRDVSATPFDSILQSNSFRQRTEQLVLDNRFFAYRLGFGLFVSSKKRQRNSLGLQASYAGSLNEEDWKVNKTQTLQNGPADILSKLSLSVLIRYQLQQKKE